MNSLVRLVRLNSPRPGGERGFTLVEVMVTIVILSVVLLALAGLLIANIRANAVSEARMDAASLAQSIAGQVAAKATVTAGYSQTAATADAQTWLGSRYDPSGLNGGYNPVVIFNPSSTVSGSYVSIVVRLSWKEHGVSKKVELRTGAVTQ